MGVMRPYLELVVEVAARLQLCGQAQKRKGQVFLLYHLFVRVLQCKGALQLPV